jgi:hypothetical protein
MRDRCLNPNNAAYDNYGGRGISICAEWRDDFDAFDRWAIEHGYDDALSIDRIDNDGDYTPQNCRWATDKEQANNKRTNRRVTAWGETKTLAEWVDDPRCCLTHAALTQRLSLSHYRKDPEKMISTPPKDDAVRRGRLIGLHRYLDAIDPGPGEIFSFDETNSFHRLSD